MPHTRELLPYILWISVIGVAALLVGVYVSRALRRRLFDQVPGDAFTIDELRRMRAAGKITQREYEAMRAAVIDRTRADPPDTARRGAAPRTPPEPDAERPDQRSEGPPDAPDE